MSGEAMCTLAVGESSGVPSSVKGECIHQGELNTECINKRECPQKVMPFYSSLRSKRMALNEKEVKRKGRTEMRNNEKPGTIATLTTCIKGILDRM